LQEQGRFSEAETSILRSLELQPVQGFGYFLLAHNRKMVEEDRPAVRQMESVASDPGLHPTDRRYVNFALGKSYDDLKSYEEAMRSLDRANGEVSGSSGGPSAVSVRYAERIRAYQRLLSASLIEEHIGFGLESAKPIFIFGMPRSGTTLLEQILSRHSQIGAGGEQCFWRDRRQRITGHRQEAVNFDELLKAGGQYLELLSSLAPSAARVTDKFPSNYVHLGLLHLIFPNATFIHSRRNPIDTCLSIYMRPFFTINEFGHSRRNIVDAYRYYLEMMAHWRVALPPGRFLEVDYESMVADPEGTTRLLVAHCGLEWEDACLSPEAGDRRVKTFSKWQVRQPVYKTSVERWRNYEPWLGIFRELDSTNPM